MKTNIDDIDLANHVGEIDEFLLQFSMKNKFSSLVTSSIILARLVWLNKQGESTEDFAKLLDTIAVGINEKQYDLPIDKKLH
jgi:hypothetical protein